MDEGERRQDVTAAPEVPAPSDARAGRVACAMAWAVVKLRFVIVAAWIAAMAYVLVIDPVPQKDPGSDVVSLVPGNSKAVAAERRAATEFEVPLSTHTAVVQ